ncbi:hypothetical protein [Nitratireductor basaltis]|uniref:Transmembrane protein n=1 Tax=Nitratireductor basaltis TaxID=472175 RepID=A0A084UBI5_9HYPH|nr:hypothetical protein [Nitratireductor basaltis]KFB10321.1 hypothetical protein EL18_01352 [Nitratireductor basaltis]
MPSLSIGAWLRAGAVLAVVGLLTFTHWNAYQRGRTAVLQRLQSDRITILKDGKEIDHEVLEADDLDLCRMLGGCLPEHEPR